MLFNPAGTYETIYTVPSFNCDCNNNLHLSGLLKFTQQVCFEHMELYGLPYESMFDMGMIFMLSKVYIRIHQMPRPNQQLKLRTCPLTPVGAQFLRAVTFEEETTGQELVRVYTSNLLVNPQTRKILRPAAFTHPLNAGDFPESMNIFKIAQPEVLHPAPDRPVRYSDIDLNGHINNTVYADIALDALDYSLPATREIREFVIQYQSEAKPEDSLNLQTGSHDPNRWYVGGTTSRGKCFEATITFC